MVRWKAFGDRGGVALAFWGRREGIKSNVHLYPSRAPDATCCSEMYPEIIRQAAKQWTPFRLTSAVCQHS